MRSNLNVLWLAPQTQFPGGGIMDQWRDYLKAHLKEFHIYPASPGEFPDEEIDLVFYGSDSMLQGENTRYLFQEGGAYPDTYKPNVLYFWGWPPQRLLDPGHFEYYMARLRVMFRCDTVLVPTPTVFDQVCIMGVRSEVIFPGINISKLPVVGGGPKTRPEKIMYLSRLSAEKNLGMVLAAMTVIPEEKRPHLTVVGPNSEDSDLVMAFAREHLFNHVTFTGAVSEEEKVRLLSETDILVHPSMYEGFGMPPLEALAMGKPVIAYDTPHMRWLLQEDAYYVSSVEGLAETIIHFYDQPVDALMRAAHGAERVRKAYSFEQASVRLWAALHQALKRSLAIRLRVEPEEWRSIYDAEHKRNWAYSLERFDPDWGRHWRARFVRQYTEGPDVLDLAAGGGVYTVLLARDGHRVTWSDISPVAMEQARIQAEKHGVSHMIDDYLVGDCRTMVTSKQYDTVWMGEVLEHLPDPDVALKNALGMVKPGGKLILTVPLGEHHFDPMHLHVWSRESFKSELLNPVVIPTKGYSVELLDEIAEEGADPSCLIAIIRRSPEEAK